MNPLRNTVLKNVESMLHSSPEKVRELCAKLFDKKEAAEAREAELRKQIDGIREMYHAEKDDFLSASRENERLSLLLAEVRGREESLVQNCERYKKKLEDALGRINELEDALSDAVQQKVDAVSNGKAIQDRLDGALKENAELSARIRGLQEQITHTDVFLPFFTIFQLIYDSSDLCLFPLHYLLEQYRLFHPVYRQFYSFNTFTFFGLDILSCL